MSNFFIDDFNPADYLRFDNNDFVDIKNGIIFSQNKSVTISAPTSSNYSLVLPNDDGDPNQVLTTDGSGNLSWSDGGGGGGVFSVSATDSIYLDDTGNGGLGDRNFSVITGAGNSLLAGSADNILIGQDSGNSITTGDSNIFFGNTTGTTLTTGSDNVIIGQNSDVSGDGVQNEIVVGNNNTGKGSNTVLLGNTSTTKVYAGDSANGSLVLIGGPADEYEIAVTASASSTESYILTLPVDSGTSGQILSTNGSGVLSWVNNSGDNIYNTDGTFGAGRNGTLTDTLTITGSTSGTVVFADAGALTASGTVQAGTLTDGTASLNSGSLTSAVNVTASGTVTGGSLVADQTTVNNNAITVTGTNDLTLNVPTGQSVDLQVNSVNVLSASGSGLTFGTADPFTFPLTDGTANQVLRTDGAGTVTWEDQTDTNTNIYNSDGTFGAGRNGTLTDTLTITGGTSGTVVFADNGVLIASGTVQGNTLTDGTVNINSGNITGVGDLALDGSTSGTITISAPTTFTSYSLTLPTDDGDSGEFLQTDGNGTLTWATAGGGNTLYTGDGTIGGTRTVTMNGNDITFDGTGNVVIADSGQLTAVTLSDSTVSINSGNITDVITLALYDSMMGESITLQAPMALPIGYTLTFPFDTGGSGQFLQTNGSGTLTWADAGGAGEFDATVGTSGADYTTITSAISAGARTIKIITNITSSSETWSYTGAVYIFIDDGVNWTLSGTNQIPNNQYLKIEGFSTDNATFTYTNSSGGFGTTSGFTLEMSNLTFVTNDREICYTDATYIADNIIMTSTSGRLLNNTLTTYYQITNSTITITNRQGTSIISNAIFYSTTGKLVFDTVRINIITLASQNVIFGVFNSQFSNIHIYRDVTQDILFYGDDCTFTNITLEATSSCGIFFDGNRTIISGLNAPDYTVHIFNGSDSIISNVINGSFGISANQSNTRYTNIQTTNIIISGTDTYMSNLVLSSTLTVLSNDVYLSNVEINSTTTISAGVSRVYINNFDLSSVNFNATCSDVYLTNGYINSSNTYNSGATNIIFRGVYFNTGVTLTSMTGISFYFCIFTASGAIGSTNSNISVVGCEGISNFTDLSGIDVVGNGLDTQLNRDGTYGQRYQTFTTTDAVAPANDLEIANTGAIVLLVPATTATRVINLPSVSGASGVNYTFILTGTAGQNWDITVADGNIIGLISDPTGNTAVLAGATATILRFISTAVIGNKAKLYCDGTNWYLDAQAVVNGDITTA